jgi:hypothetical protein
MKITIKEVTNKHELKKFIKFPIKLYRDNAYFVPPIIKSELLTLAKDKNSAFEFCESKYWLAVDENNAIVGRIAGIINNRYNQKVGKTFARFGWIDFIENEMVLCALFQTVEAWAREKNAEYIHGPLGFTSFDQSGVLIEGFDELPTAYGKYNFSYYSKLIERCDYTKEVDWVEYKVTVPYTMPERFTRLSEMIEKKYNLHCVKLDSKKELPGYAKEMFQLINKAYDKIHGFSELSEKQIDSLIKAFIPMLRLKYISIVQNAENKMVGVGICLPSLSKALQKCRGRLFPFGFLHLIEALRFNDTVDTLIIAVDPEYTSKGINALIFNQIGSSIISNGFKYIETTRELENNFQVLNLWNKFEYQQHKKSRCYFKTLQQ